MNDQPLDRLDALRSKIDAVDEKIANLLENRMDLVCEVADFKRVTGKSVLDVSREQAVLENINKKINNPDYAGTIQSVFRHIIQTSREYQQNILTQSPQTDRTNKFCLIGEKLSHSLSPQIHTNLFKKLGIHGSYDLVEVTREDLPGIVGKLRREGYAGFNVTIPYKKDIMQYLDKLSPEAIRIGSVNTVLLGESATGYNTDYHGFGFALDAGGFNPEGRKCAVLGSGGSALAVVAWLEDHQAAGIAIVSRDPDAALFKFPGLLCLDIDSFRSEGYDIVINTTPVGMYPNVSGSPLGKEQLEGAGYVMDLLFNPKKTLLLRYAGELGISHANGFLMLVAQAIYAEELWLGRKMERELVLSIYNELKGLA